MCISSRVKIVMSASLLAVLASFCVSASTYARHNDVVTFAEGQVGVDDDGTVWVCISDPRNSDCEPDDTLFPSNGHGLLRSGQIDLGDTVEVKIVQDKKHRGHVTILK